MYKSQFQKLTLMTGFVVHILYFPVITNNNLKLNNKYILWQHYIPSSAILSSNSDNTYSSYYLMQKLSMCIQSTIIDNRNCTITMAPTDTRMARRSMDTPPDIRPRPRPNQPR